MAFDSAPLAPLWKELHPIIRFVHDRLKYGQRSYKLTQMEPYISNAYNSLQGRICSTPEHHMDRHRLIFLKALREAFLPVFDWQRKVVKSVNLVDFYRCLYKIQRLALESPQWSWEGNPFTVVFPSEPPERDRSRSPREPSRKHEDIMGRNGVFGWKNPPSCLYDDRGFQILCKSWNWICNTPADPEQVTNFMPRPGMCDGSLTAWLYATMSEKHPFLAQYDLQRTMEYGLMHRLDRETSGAILVAKDEKHFIKLKASRENDRWHKEYVCLLHGHIPTVHGDGVLQNWFAVLGKHGGDKATVRIFSSDGDALRDGEFKTFGISSYSVLRYFATSEEKYTLVKVLISTGVRHQIRVHMQHLLKRLGSEQTGSENYGIVGDFLYLSPNVARHDRQHLCPRVFLHARAFGMWHPTDGNKVVSAVADMPLELRSCLDTLTEDSAAMADLGSKLRSRRDQDDVQSFCQKFNISPLLKEELQNRSCWVGSSSWRRDALLHGFEARLNMPEVETLSVDGDYTLLLGSIMASAAGAANKHILEELLVYCIDARLQGRVAKVTSSTGLPPGWQQLEGRDGQILFAHEGGQTTTRKPVLDPALPDGWLKLEHPQHKSSLYFNAATKAVLSRKPAREDLPAGWVKLASTTRRGSSDYYIHLDSGIAQVGFPCAGSPERLPASWEKVQSKSRDVQYYFNRATGEHSSEKPESHDS